MENPQRLLLRHHRNLRPKSEDRKTIQAHSFPGVGFCALLAVGGDAGNTKQTRTKMQPYLDKVFDEFRDLESKLNELRDFMANPEQWKTVSPDNQERMEMQANVMTLYLHILNNRIKTYSPAA